MGWECFCVVGFDLGPLLQGRTRILHLQYFFKYVLTYFLHLNSYLVTFLHNTICRAQLLCLFLLSASEFLPFTVLLYSTFPDNYAFLSLLPSQIKNTQSALLLFEILCQFFKILFQFFEILSQFFEIVISIFISRRALAREGDYETMPVCACVRVLVSHADFS